MKKLNLLAPLKARAFRVGGYSVAAVCIVVAIAVAANVLVNALPARMTQFDTSAQQLFSISEQTETLVSGLEDDIQMYWVVQSGQEDSTLGTLLDRYESLSGKIHVEKRDPDVYPAFVQQYATSISNNSVVVESGERYRYVDYYDIYEFDYSSYYYTGSYDVSFAGESALTSAIDYVISDEIPKIYTLTGHGESTLATTFSSAVEKENMEIEELSLLTLEAVPGDAGCLLINAPQSDISTEEKDILSTYLESGGDMLLITGPLPDGRLENLEDVMAVYGLTTAEGIVVEGDAAHYAFSGPYNLLPEYGYHAITSPLSEGGYYVCLPLAQGLIVGEASRDTVSVTKLLTTSNAAFAKVAGYQMTTYEKEDGDMDGPFALAVAVTENAGEENESDIVWVSSGALLDEQTNMRVSGGNQDFFLNCLGWMCDPGESSITIHAKSLNYEYLTMDTGTSSLLTVVLVGVLPLAYLGVGIYTWARRKRR